MKLTNLPVIAFAGLMSMSSIAMASWATSNQGLNLSRAGTSDSVIKAQLLTTFALNPFLNNRPIEVQVNNGEVTLAGTVGDAIENQLADEIAHAPAGVTKVVDKLAIESNAPKILQKDNFSTKVNDLTTTANITYNLQKNPQLGPYQITVTTLNGAVNLMGEVNTFEQKTLAQQIASNTSGALMVANNLKVVANINPQSGGVTQETTFQQ